VAQIIDRRLNGKNKSAVNRRRFIERYRTQIKKAVSDAIAGRSITEIEKGEKISIPSKDISEPTFRHGSGGTREIVHPGNKEFVAGDKIPRPGGGGRGRGKQASNTGEGMDEFVFQLSKEEFLEFFFEDLELPNLVKTQIAKIPDVRKQRAGHTHDGTPSNINVVRSMRGATGRRIALRAPYAKRLDELEAELQGLLLVCGDADPRVLRVRKEMDDVRRKMAGIPFIDPFDLRYNNRIEKPKPTTQAVMFCIMDISGSMDQTKKDIAKRFFILLYLFLTRAYEKIELVFISHHTVAKEVSEEDFFYSRETGGTVVSSALKLMSEIAQARYPTGDWNIYAAQASDGDNWNDDSPICRDILISKIAPLVQYFAYIEITNENPQNLWREYLSVQATCKNFAMQRIESVNEIYPVFRELFKKQLV
jgi:uncharacterized sporulation protein YeaH/YhbH (DUF444 family)